MKKSTPLFLILFCFLLFFPSQTFDASKTGLLLWFDTLLPTLLPFLILSQLILKTSIIHNIQIVIGPIFKKIFHCSESGAFCILSGFLCGYPVGARLISLLLEENQITTEEGQYLLSFCNNVSPMFCISYGILHTIDDSTIFPYLIFIYGSALAFGFFTRPKFSYSSLSDTKKQTPSAENIFQLIDVCIIDSFVILIKLCGYLILFSIINTGISMLIPSSALYARSFLGSLLEITSGLSQVKNIPNDFLRTALAIAALSFGGLCCIFQTSCVIANTNLSIKKYTLHKGFTTILALFFYCFFYFSERFFSINRWS